MVGDSKSLYKMILTLFLLLVFFVNTESSQSDQDIFFEYCTIHPQSDCFNPVDGAVDTVGRNVVALGGGYKFCLQIEKIDGGIAPIRVVLVLDKSYSMCGNSGECCVEGDGTDSCMMNDPEDKRIQASIEFVNNLASKSPLSEVGVVVYDTRANAYQPIALNSPANIDMVHQWINTASCANSYTVRDRDDRITTDDQQGGLTKTVATKATYLGLGLSEGLETIDVGFNPNLARHIILLTDGAWDDPAGSGRSPGELVAAYKASNPDRPVPTLHGVFLSNSELHLRHGFPSEGCSNDDMVFLDSLKAATILGGTQGQYFGGSTPQTVVANFDSLLKSVTVFEAQRLTGIIVTNTTNGVVRNQKTIDTVPSTIEQQIHYETTIDNLPLEFGLNTLTIQQLIKKPGVEVPEAITSTVSIYRTKKWTTEINAAEYQQFCTKDSTTVSINVTPPVSFINAPFDVHASILLKDFFLLDTVQVRLFTRNSDNQDENTLALFHCDNDLTSAAGNVQGVNTDAVFSTTDALFGSHSITGGSFKVPVGSITGDFAIEAWVRPSATSQRQDIFTCNMFSLAIANDHYLYLKIGGNEIKSAFPITDNTWSHIAVSRTNNTMALYINGIDASLPQTFQEALSGEVTISAPQAGGLDEIRISSTSRLRSESDGLLRFNVASFENPTWTIGSVSAGQQLLTVAPEQWNNGNLDFQFSCPDPGKVIVNFQHRGTSQETQWSKNGNPVTVATSTDLTINVTPPQALINDPFTVRSSIASKEYFILESIEARIFTSNSDIQDAQTIALFHCDHDLVNTSGTTAGVDAGVMYSSTDALFGNGALSGGSFNAAVGTITDDFAIEAWIKSSGATSSQGILSCTAFTLSITDDQYLSLVIDGKEIKSVRSIPANTWTHIAVSRMNNKITLYLNGINASEPVVFQGAISGDVTVMVPSSGVLDEVRISTTSRAQVGTDGILRFNVASLNNPTWTLGGVPALQQSLTISPDKWNNGNLEFQFSSPVPGKVVVNFQHGGTSQETQWSKNGNPVTVTVSTDLTITVTPPLSFVNTPFTVHSTITLVKNFILDTIQARVLIENPDIQDEYTIALFHLDKDLTNTVGDAEGVSVDITYSSDDALFGNHAMKSGSFKVPVGMISGDFAVETWVKSSSASEPQVIFNCNAFSLGITGDRYLYLVVGEKEIKSTLPVVADNWSHIAVSRINGNLVLFINGIDASESLPFQENFSGVLTISAPQSGVLDEVRISSVNRLRLESDGSLRFDIASLENPVWTLGGVPVTQPFLTITPDKWNNGNLELQFSSPIPGNVVVNFQHPGISLDTKWSKNGNPVTVAADLQGPYVLNSIYTRGDFGTDFDTLHVFFTEPVRCDSLKVDLRPKVSFEIYDSNKVLKPDIFEGAEYLDNTCPSDPNDQMISEIRMKVRVVKNGIIPKRDSIRLIGITVDASGNPPDTTKRGPINYGPGNNCVIYGIPNPPGNAPMTLDHEDMIRLGIPDDKIHSKLILIQSREVLYPWNTVDGLPNYCEKSVVYDAVGNIVTTDVPIRRSQYDDLMYYVVWNGLNSNNRRVGSGGYLFRATIMYMNDVGRKVTIQRKFRLNWGVKE